MRQRGRIWRNILFRAKSEPVLEIDGQSLPVLVRRYPQAKGYRLRYDAVQCALRLSMPVHGSERDAIQWARSQHDWVKRQMVRTIESQRLEPGAQIVIEGVERLIVWEKALARTPRLEENRLYVGGPEESLSSRLLRWLRRHALATLTAETHEYAAKEQLNVASVRIGDPRSRWGSCSVDGHIRYSWRLILAPPDVRRATVAHEVAHLLHMDHSPAFHAAHARLFGEDTAPARAWLKANGAALHALTA